MRQGQQSPGTGPEGGDDESEMDVFDDMLRA